MSVRQPDREGMMSEVAAPDSRVEVLPDFESEALVLPAVSHAAALKEEPMFRKSSEKYARENGGPVTRRFLEMVRTVVGFMNDLIVDTRVHMLKPGWYPGIPGWHVDELKRGEDGQPDVRRLRDKPSPVHYALIIDFGTDSLTEFVSSPVVLPAKAPVGRNLYELWTLEVGFPLPRADVKTRQVRSGELIRFGVSALHRAMPATGNGWRWWGRATVHSARKPVNEIRRQSNVYMENLIRGW